MQIRRFYSPEIPAPGAEVALMPEEARHAVQVLRLRKGDRLGLLDGRGTLADAEVTTAGPRWRDGVQCRICRREARMPPAVRLHLYVAPPRGKAMGQVVRSAVELGAWRIVPILCQYGVSRPDPGGEGDRWEQDALAALKQSGNPFRPLIEPPAAFAKALSSAPPAGYFGAVPRDNQFRRTDAGQDAEDVALWVGPEGGFADAEEMALAERGYRALALGRWILRVETAVPALLGHVIGRIADG